MAGVDSIAMIRRALPLLAGVVSLALIGTACGLPDIEDYKALPLAQTSFLYAADGSLITELHAAEDRVVLRRGQMTQDVRDAAVAIEDRRFYFHHGVDVQAILRAAVVNAEAGTVVEGGSTITQQLVKNLYVGDEESFRRKIDEASLAWQLEDRLTKDQILTKYLNTVYFGEGAYGVEAAAQTYFGIPADALTLAQSAMLAGLITAPNHFDPYVRIRSARGRRNVVLRLMLKQEMITRDEYRAARHEPIVVRRATPVQRYPYPYFVDYFKQWFLGNPAFGPTRDARAKLLFTGGLHITTTLDPDLQKLRADRGSLRARVSERSVGGHDGPRPAHRLRAGDGRRRRRRLLEGPVAGRVNLATGEGGTGRQSGSSFKPFALVAALEHGISPSTVFAAPATIQIPLDNGEVWNVTNAEGSGYGSMTLESATINSVNTVYAQLIEQLGADTVVETATRMGLRCCPRVSEPRTPLLPYLSAVLGTNEVNTLEMSSAYGTLATGGQHVNPIPVIRVTDAKGNVLWEANPKPKQVVDPQVASVANQILEEVVLYGTGTAANIGRPQIGKTGHRRHPHERLVRRLAPAADGGRVGGVPARRDPDGATHHAHHRVRRHVARPDLAPLHAEGRCRPAGAVVPDARRRLRDGRGRHHPGPVLPPEPLHAPAEHRLPRLHRGHGAHEDLHDADLAPERDGPVGDRHDPGPRRGGALGRGVRRRRDGDAVDAAARAP